MLKVDCIFNFPTIILFDPDIKLSGVSIGVYGRIRRFMRAEENDENKTALFPFSHGYGRMSVSEQL
jgi:hypothetical protein